MNLMVFDAWGFHPLGVTPFIVFLIATLTVMAKPRRKFGTPKEWVKPKIEIEWVKDEMTSSSTTGTLIDLFTESPQFSEFKKCLPARVSNNSYPTEVFALSFLAGFLHGQDSIDDQEEFEDDPGIESVLGETPRPRAMGDWLRSFSSDDLKRLKGFLHLQAMGCRKKLQKISRLF